MERISIIRNLRKFGIEFPSSYSAVSHASEVLLITKLLQHDPDLRPSAKDLPNLLPTKIKRESVSNVLKTLTQPNSPYKSEVMDEFFSAQADQLEYIYEDRNAFARGANSYVAQQVDNLITQVFRRHAASSQIRSMLFPYNTIYDGKTNVVKLLDQAGNLLQLPYDFTVPFARAVARHGLNHGKYFCFGQVFRSLFNGTQSRSIREVDFDAIWSDEDESKFHEAETLKVVDEILEAIPALNNINTFFRFGHCGFLHHIFDQCNVLAQNRDKVASMLAQNSDFANLKRDSAFQRLLTNTSIQDLEEFHFELKIKEGLAKMKLLLRVQDEYTEKAFHDLEALQEQAAVFRIRHPFKFSPFAILNHRYYSPGLCFQVVCEIGSRQEVLCAGGRYDQLIENMKMPGSKVPRVSVMGFGLALEKLYTWMEMFCKGNPSPCWITGQLDVLVSSYGNRTAAIDLLAELWSVGISAELAPLNLTTDNLVALGKSRGVDCLAQIRERKANANTLVKIRSIGHDKQNVEVVRSDALIHLQSISGQRHRSTPLPRTPSLPRQTSSTNILHEVPVTVLADMDDYRKIKAGHKHSIVSKAMEQVDNLVERIQQRKIPVLVTDLGDDIIQSIKRVRLNDEADLKRSK